MLKSRRTFLQGAAALLASLPFAGQLFASVPPVKPPLLTKPITLADILKGAELLYLRVPEWRRRCNLVCSDIMDSLNYRPLPIGSHPAAWNTVTDVLVYGNAFPYQRLNGIVGLFAPHDVEMKWDHHAYTCRVYNKSLNPMQEAEVARGPATHIRMCQYAYGLKTIGWGVPMYWDPKRRYMPTVTELRECFDEQARAQLQRFIDRLS